MLYPMMATLRKYAPFIVVALVVLYFRREILNAMPTGVARFFGGAA